MESSSTLNICMWFVQMVLAYLAVQDGGCRHARAFASQIGRIIKQSDNILKSNLHANRISESMFSTLAQHTEL